MTKHNTQLHRELNRPAILTTVNGGIGNRFFHLLTGYYFCHRLNLPLDIYWADNSSCEVMWTDILETPSPNFCSIYHDIPSGVFATKENSIDPAGELENQLFLLPDFSNIQNDKVANYRACPGLSKHDRYERVFGGDDGPSRSADDILNIINFNLERAGRAIEAGGAASGVLKRIIVWDCNPTVLTEVKNQIPRDCELANQTGGEPYGAKNWSPNYDSNQVIKDFLENVWAIKKDIREEAKRFCEENGINGHSTMGFHFRTITLGKINMEIAMDEVKKAIDTPGVEKIFVCADDEKIENDLRKQWPSKIVSYTGKKYMEKLDKDKDWLVSWHPTDGGMTSCYNLTISKQAVVDAMIDCLILSQTNMISVQELQAGRGYSHTGGWAGTFFVMARCIKEYGKKL